MGLQGQQQLHNMESKGETVQLSLPCTGLLKEVGWGCVCVGFPFYETGEGRKIR